MTVNEKVEKIVSILEDRYTDAICSLEYSKPYELLIAVRLSAQCTDARVNIVCKSFFAEYDTLEKIAALDVAAISNIVRTCGFYKVKAQNIHDMANILLKEYNGVVPDTMAELLKLPGVGRKSANLILGDVYGKPAIVADTHCIRISNRLGLVNSTDPYKVELKLKRIIPPDKSNDFCHRLVLFGRDICVARKPKCEICPIGSYCKYRQSSLKE